MATAQLRPDLRDPVDITMPVLDGFTAAREITKRLPGVGILLLSMHESASMVNIAKSSGARGYVAKSEGIARLVKAVDAIAHNQTFFSQISPLLRSARVSHLFPRHPKNRAQVPAIQK